jgi:predicted AlkP superfamily pyrophosphatase or phosphodiesterase
MSKRLASLSIFAWLLFALLASASAQRSEPAATPRLVVLISIDQFRADYLTRFEDLFLPARTAGGVGGFRWFMDRGAWYVDAHHDHMPLATGPGHSILLTGAPPYKSGIVGNDWYDRDLKKDVYCVQDDNSPIVGTDTKMIGISPEHLRVTTVGDELKIATGGKAKVFGISLKDRAAVLMAGHLADGVYWFDYNAGRWVTSHYYRKDETLPAWVEELNREKLPDAYFDKTWNPVTPDSAKRVWTPSGKYAADRGLGGEFPHVMNAGQTAPNAKYYSAFTGTPFANEFVLNSAERLIREEKLGQDETPDVLAINLASNDYIGHTYGATSREVLDVTVQTDRMLSKFFNDLNGMVPGGLSNVTVVITADHGASPNTTAMRESGIPGGWWNPIDAVKVVQAAMEAAFGRGHWIIEYNEPYLWLDHDALKAKKIPLEHAEEVAARAMESVKGVYACYTRSKVLEGLVPNTDIAHHVTLGWHPALSGDVVVISQPFFVPATNAKGGTHGEPYAYDTRVPLLVQGFGVRSGTYTERVSTLDIAPTLSFLLHTNQPSGCEGRILSRALLADGPRGR